MLGQDGLGNADLSDVVEAGSEAEVAQVFVIEAAAPPELGRKLGNAIGVTASRWILGSDHVRQNAGEQGFDLVEAQHALPLAELVDAAADAPLEVVERNGTREEVRYSVAHAEESRIEARRVSQEDDRDARTALGADFGDAEACAVPLNVHVAGHEVVARFLRRACDAATSCETIDFDVDDVAAPLEVCRSEVQAS